LQAGKKQWARETGKMSIQHVFTMFGATIPVPILTGLDPATALFTAGTGILIFIMQINGYSPKNALY
jgi:uracil permease